MKPTDSGFAAAPFESAPELEPGGAVLRVYQVALAAVADLLGPAAERTRISPELAFLLDVRELVLADAAAGPAEDTAAALATALAFCRAQPAAEDGRLQALAARLELTPVELLSVALLQAVELLPMVGRAIAAVQAPVGGSRPTFGLLQAALGRLSDPSGSALGQLVAGAASASGLLTTGGEQAPLIERPLQLRDPFALMLDGVDVLLPGTRCPAPGHSAELGDAARIQAQAHAQALLSGRLQALAIRAGAQQEGEAAALEVIRAMGRAAVVVDGEPPPGLAAYLALTGRVPVFPLHPGPGERVPLPQLATYPGPVLLCLGPEGAVAAGAAVLAQWSLPVPDRDERVRVWQELLREDREGLARAHELGRAHRLSLDGARRLAALAGHQARTAGRAQLRPEDFRLAAQIEFQGMLGSLAQPVADAVADEGLVLPEQVRAALDALAARCREREGLAEGLGEALASRYRSGVRALLVGPSGTGKTLAAAWLATRLAKPLYRVDLASVTSKYIGETEKNLAQLLAHAEHGDVILLFDEADSMFGKRTDVSDANDRFANAQTNYLLQRIETYDGIVILTSNSRGRFDEAFWRRLDFVIEFAAPDAIERKRLWLEHLGAGHGLGEAQLNRLAVEVDLSGGHIRNAVLNAQTFARSRAAAIGERDLLQAVALELAKLGRALPSVLHQILATS